MKSRKAIKRIVDAERFRGRFYVAQMRIARAELMTLKRRIETLSCMTIVKDEEIGTLWRKEHLEDMVKWDAAKKMAEEIMKSDCITIKEEKEDGYTRYMCCLKVVKGA